MDPHLAPERSATDSVAAAGAGAGAAAAPAVGAQEGAAVECDSASRAPLLGGFAPLWSFPGIPGQQATGTRARPGARARWEI